MDIHEFARIFPERMRKLEEFTKPSDDLKQIAGTEAQEFYKESFKNQGFTDETLQPWTDVKRRDPNSPWYGHSSNKEEKYFNQSRTTAKILSNTTELERAIYFEKTATGVRVYNEKPYARVHNFGGTAKVYGKWAFQMLARPFIGPSKTMVERIHAQLRPRLKDIIEGR